MSLLWVIWVDVAIGLFAVFEAYAIDHPNSSWTMSHTVAFVGSTWLITIALMGALFGALIVHWFGQAFIPRS
jgi:hypothetical protein